MKQDGNCPRRSGHVRAICFCFLRSYFRCDFDDTRREGRRWSGIASALLVGSMFAGDTRDQWLTGTTRRRMASFHPPGGGGEGTTAPIHPAGSGPGLPLRTNAKLIVHCVHVIFTLIFKRYKFWLSFVNSKLEKIKAQTRLGCEINFFVCSRFIYQLKFSRNNVVLDIDCVRGETWASI